MANFDTIQPAQIQGVGGTGYIVDPIVTVGDLTPADGSGYLAPGIPDGLGAYALDDATVRLLVNHEGTVQIEFNQVTLYSGVDPSKVKSLSGSTLRV